MLDYRIMKEWSDSLGDYYYELQLWVNGGRGHSCYGCYDAWSWQRNKCSSNSDRWETKATGNLAWAKRLEDHYKIVIGDTKGK